MLKMVIKRNKVLLLGKPKPKTFKFSLKEEIEENILYIIFLGVLGIWLIFFLLFFRFRGYTGSSVEYQQLQGMVSIIGGI